MSQEPHPGLIRGRYLLAGFLFAVIGGCAGISVVSRAWNACDVGINASANAFGLVLLQLPVLTLVHLVVFIGGYALVGQRRVSKMARFGAAALVTVVVLAAVSWAYFALAGLPLQNAFCPGGEPSWWPRWLPPAHDVYP